MNDEGQILLWLTKNGWICLDIHIWKVQKCLFFRRSSYFDHIYFFFLIIIRNNIDKTRAKCHVLKIIDNFRPCVPKILYNYFSKSYFRSYLLFVPFCYILVFISWANLFFFKFTHASKIKERKLNRVKNSCIELNVASSSVFITVVVRRSKRKPLEKKKRKMTHIVGWTSLFIF
jgi:hypothetical protein